MTTLAKSDYKDIQQVDIKESRLVGVYYQVAKEIANNYGGPRVLQQLLKTRRDWPHHKMKLNVLVKTHKAQGEQGCRNIHSCNRYPWNAMAYWCSEVLERYLERVKFALRRMECFVKKAKKDIDVDPSHRLVKIDVEHFYVSGDPIQLAETASFIIDDDEKLRHVLQRALAFLLSHQYLESEWLKGRVWHVRRGNGMGWRVSGPVADAALYVAGEKSWAARNSILCQHGLSDYVRFRDDILVIAKEFQGLFEWFSEFKTRVGQIFELQAAEVSRSEVGFLQVNV